MPDVGDEVVKCKWITLVRQENVGRTRRWTVRENKGGNELGTVRWYGPWRRYCFLPWEGTIYEQDCMRDLADFCEEATIAQKQRLSGF